jgi:acetyl-CoA synthetase
MELIKDTAQFEEIYHKSCHQPELFWDEIASDFTWKKRWDKVLSWNFTEPNVQWFVNGKMNITENCLDRHLPEKSDQIAFYWEPNSPDKSPRSFTYLSLYQEVNKVANSLKQYGINKGDRICFYMPMVPELAIAILACARIGAVHSVVFAGFSAQSLADRIEDSQCKMVICSDFNDRGAKHIAVKQVVDDALQFPGCQCVENVLVYKNTGDDVKWYPERDLWWHDVVPNQSNICEAESMDSEDMLFILYTSGSTGKPKGVVHTCGGYMVYTAYSFKQVFQIKDNDLYWCTADIGWITGHSYIVYGPLLTGATSLMFEGVPTFPDAGRFWEICDKYNVTHFYTAPTAIRALMAYGNSFV